MKHKDEVQERMNQLHVIAPYKHRGLWVFDDPKAGLAKEPFVNGADAMIDVMTRGIPDAPQGFTMVFSAHPFPGYQYSFLRRRTEGPETIYYSPNFDVEGWLSHAVLRYFDAPPQELFVQVQAMEKQDSN